jgi:hypothetical protein
MKKTILITLLVTAFSLFMGQTAFSEEETAGSKFLDRDLLVKTLSGGIGIEEPVTDERAEAFVESLSDEQVFAFNRALNNALKNRLYREILYDLDLLESLDVQSLTKQDINAITKAFEEETKFNNLYEKTGDEKFLAVAGIKKVKFMTKAGIEMGEETGSETEPTASEMEGPSELAGKEAKKAAKMAVKDARKAAKMAAKDAKKAAKEAAKEAKKNSKGKKGKGKGKGKKK